MNNNGFRFKDWQVYKDTINFRRSVKKCISTYPKEERYALSDQTSRALSSILLNIAEGGNDRTDKDTKLFIIRSMGSLYEVVACLDCALDDGYITNKQYDTLIIEAESLAKQLKGFILYLSKKSKIKD